MILYAATIFVSAFLLFLVQPVIAKQILPWFGGSAAVWTTCLVFFQFLLLFGYAYSDWTTRNLCPRRQVRLHVALLLVSLVWLPIIPGATWKPAGDQDPVTQILGLLAVTIGLPYFLLATTGPLVQAWFARSFPAGTVYRLFALSNFASLAALVAYPPLIEPWTLTRTQSIAWSAGYVAFVALCAAAGFFSLRSTGHVHATPDAQAQPPAPLPPGRDYALWLALSAMGSYMLLAVTNHITQNVASVPFLWILPLVLYLLTFILCFEGRGWYQRRYFLGPLAVIVLAMAWGLNAGGGIMDVIDAVPLYCVGLFVCCMFYHGELANLKPAPRYLTRFYLMISLGGALGGLFVGVVAPLVFATYYEFGIALVITGLLAVHLLWRLPGKWIPATALGVTSLCAFFVYQYIDELGRGSTVMLRNFYGALRVQDVGAPDDPNAVRRLLHGVIMHGEQYQEVSLRRQPTSYYGPDSGIGLALEHYRERPLRVGVIGLGTGTLAAWGKPGDVFKFYELDPQVLAVAQSEFTYLRDTQATIETALGDARLTLEREPAQRFDLLVIDAFSSDSIPVHLITREALQVYLRHMQPDGIIAFHVTNRYLDLPPVVKMIADANDMPSVLIEHDPDEGDERYSNTDWMLVTRNRTFLQSPALVRAGSEVEVRPQLSLWTDDFNNLLRILK